MDFNGRLGFWFGLGFSFGFSIGSGFGLVWIWIEFWFSFGFGFLRLTIQRCSGFLPSHSLFDKQDESIDFWNNMPVKGLPIWKYPACNMPRPRLITISRKNKKLL